MSDKFILMGKEKELLVYLEQYVLNSLPKNEKVLRDNLTLEMYETIKNTAKVSMNKGNVRQKYLNDVKVNIVMIDFYIGVAYSKNLVIKKRFLSCIKKIEEISGKSYYGNEKAFRIIADHIKAAVFISSDPAGIKPSNTDQGYILRRLIRRAIRYAKMIDIDINSNWESEIAKNIIDE